MPRAKDPGSIKTGPGKTALAPTDKLVLLGSSMTGAPPNVGQPGYLPADSTSLGDGILGFPAPTDDPGSAGLMAHVDDPVDAHEASAIGMTPDSKVLFSHNVQGALDELATGVAAMPPMLGQQFKHMTFSGIPDWGALKMWDTSDGVNVYVYPMYPHHGFSWPASPDGFPGQYNPPSPSADWAVQSGTRNFYSRNGIDPSPDPIWNSGSPFIAGVYGSGWGETRAGAFTNADKTVNRSRAIPFKTMTGLDAYVSPVTISGTIFPADRGVFAIIHWPVDGNFLGQDPLDRVVAAIVLGDGLSSAGAGCISKYTVPPLTCDGSPGIGPDSGSIFSIGMKASKYDPFAYPGQATGQYDLHEIVTGVSDYTGETLPDSWGMGWTRTINSTVVGPGQVRWATDPTVDPASVKPYGIPVLGSNLDFYAGGPIGTVPIYNIDASSVDAVPHIGQSLITPTNFFGYRLPYLKDYSYLTGLKHTPRGTSILGNRETRRYFWIKDNNSFYPPDKAYHDPRTVWYLNDTMLIQAGAYDNFEEDHFDWQIARYRHSFYIPGSDVRGAPCGTYWAIHFKKEADFEAFARDGIMPWDVTNGYDVYGANLAVTPDPADDFNLVSNVTGIFTSPVGTGPASMNYGFAAKSYHVLRSNIVTSDSDFDGNTPIDVVPTTQTFSWTQEVGHQVMYVSGVAYFMPLKVGGQPGFYINGLNIVVSNVFTDFYRTDDNPYTDVPNPPASLSSPCPAILSMGPFNGSLTYDNAAFGPYADRYDHFEIPFQYLGSNGSGPYSESNGPISSDTMTINSLGAYGKITFNSGCFSTDGNIRCFIRRPMLRNPQPESTQGILLTSTGDVAGAKILYVGVQQLYYPGANSVVTPGVHPSVVHVNQYDDTRESFRGEVYRYYSNLNKIGTTTGAALLGPGMAGWAPRPIAAPVRIGLTTDATWRQLSFAQYEEFKNNLTTHAGITTELQVAGFPDRNPLYELEGSEGPLPDSGLLIYPQKDYSAGYVPDNSTEGGGFAQPDYSAATGTRTYVRCFDAGFSTRTDNNGDPNPVDAADQPFVYLRIDGLLLSDFWYRAPGPGGLGDGLDATKYTGVAIMLKVPGLTTWMDIGRPDGDGPSKQDPTLDGAGCLVLGPQTFSPGSDKILDPDPHTQLVYTQVKINVGPMINLARGQVSSVPPIREVPVLIKVIMNELAIGYNMEGEAGVVGGPPNFGPPDPNLGSRLIRGLCGIKVLMPIEIQSAPDRIPH